MSKNKQKTVATQEAKPVKTTLTLDVELHSRLCFKAAKMRMGVSALAVEFIREGLRGVVAFDRGDSSGPVKVDDRPALASGTSSADKIPA